MTFLSSNYAQPPTNCWPRQNADGHRPAGRKPGYSATELALARTQDQDFPEVLQNYANNFPDAAHAAEEGCMNIKKSIPPLSEYSHIAVTDGLAFIFSQGPIISSKSQLVTAESLPVRRRRYD